MIRRIGLASAILASLALPAAAQSIAYPSGIPSGGALLQNATSSAIPSVLTTTGLGFAKGTLPSGSGLTATIGGTATPVQLDVHSTWPDGSGRWASETFMAPALAAGASTPLVNTVVAPASSGTYSSAALLANDNATGSQTTGLAGGAGSGSYYTPAHTMTVAEPPAWTSDSASVLSTRFAAYKALGLTTIRVNVAWSEIENTYGTFVAPPEIAYMKAAIAAGLRLKIVVYTTAGEPYSYFQAKPNSQLIDANGNTTYLQVSYWLPGYEADVHLITDKLIAAVAGTTDAEGVNNSANLLPDGTSILAHTDAVLATYGTAGENLYPSAGYLSFTPSFWAYDVNAQADFTAKMTAKYSTIAAANTAWGTSYTSFPPPPKPGGSGVTSAEWTDFLYWYRNEKRAYAAWQLMDTQATLAKYAPTNTPLVTVPIAGLHLSPEQFNTSVADEGASDAADDDAIVSYTDNEFLTDLCHQNPGCVLHVTSLPNDVELAYVRAYELATYSAAAPVEGENNGHDDRIVDIASNAMAFGMSEADQIDGTDLFGSDHETTNATYFAYQTAIAFLTKEWAGTAAYSQVHTQTDYAFILEAGTCLPLDPTGNVKACLSQQGQFQVIKAGTVLWTDNMSPSTYACATGQPYNLTCAMYFTGQLYKTGNANNQIWNSENTDPNNANMLIFTDAAPYIHIEDGSGDTIWTTGLTQ